MVYYKLVGWLDQTSNIADTSSDFNDTDSW